MTSSDHEILISINNQITNINQRLLNIEQKIVYIEQDLAIQKVKLEDLQTSLYWFFAGIGLYLAAFVLLPHGKKEPKNFSFTEIREIVRFELANNNSSKNE